VSEGDDVDLSVERVIGGRGPDRLVGGAGFQILEGGGSADVLEGGDGDDQLIGGNGADRIDGGPGSDLVDAGAGNDTIRVRDGARERSVACGPGRDLVDADPIDDTAPSSSCERVRIYAVGDGPPGAVTSPRLLIRGATVRLRITCPRAARIACRGRVAIGTATKRPRELVTAPYRVRVGRSANVRMTMSANYVRLLRARKRAAATTRERGVPKGAQRWAVAVLPVR
ncbi:MAG: hypothetical protein AB1416_06860, partial [Actinomycetota bacterium]